ncbi:hypothetical protein FHS18_005209 [Paenibacillus phyllosphaerae]|uniref:Uncharacterized protein n=1 Tax=Paenibacillus phyllosphaerae TaxID=274593 RepID=A0A7W5B3N5_9BACL|nr:hypothetical protein [Paenibacillus phyllosphaerae]MBB3113106.1 hypothetical protein [Paenibacillus phyllosphaerae]
MIFLSVCIIFVAISIVALRKAGVLYSFSKGVALAAGISLLALVCLAQNYTQSLIPEANDGISVSNQIAYWIIGEDGWSHELFLEKFKQSIYLTGILIILYPVILVAESKFSSKN